MTKARAIDQRPQADVTVIVAAYNRAGLVARTLDSIAAQTLAPRQIIVVDDASTDATAHTVTNWIEANDLPAVLICQPNNGGVAQARNTGMLAAETDYLAFVDSDDIWLPHALETLVLPLQQIPDAVLSCADAIVSGGQGGQLLAPRIDVAHDLIQVGDEEFYMMRDAASLLLLTSMIPTCAAVFRRKAALEVGLMPDLRTGEDWLFWLKLAADGRFLVQLRDVASVLRHDDNLTHGKRDSFTAHEHLRALLGLQDGSLGVELTMSQQQRVAAAISEKAGHWRYHLSRQGWKTYWRGLEGAEARATGGRIGHILSDPRSALRAVAASFS